MLDNEVRAIVTARLQAALTKNGSELVADREKAMDFYYGRPMGNEQEGRAQVVSKDLMDTVEWIMPSLMRIFCTMDATQFDPVGPEDEQLAREETGYVRHVLWKKNPGFMILYEWLKTALLQKVGYVKYWWEDSKKVSFKRYSGLTDEQLTLLMQDLESNGKVEVEEQEQEEGGWSVKLKFTSDYGCARVDGSPPEDLVISAECKGDIKKAKFVGHIRTDLTRSDLIEMGYEQKRVKALSDFTWENLSSEVAARDSVQESARQSETDSDWPSETIRLLEAYTYLDENDDGIAELRCILMSGNDTLEDEEAEEIQWCSATPIPIPYRHIGLSLYDLVEDLQRIHTALKRGLLDNVYFTNAPRQAYNKDVVDLQTLQINRPGGHVAVEGPPGGQIVPLSHQPIVGEVLQVIGHFDSVRDRRTGSTAMQTGSDADVLASTTKGAYMDARAAANQRIEAIARIFAETGLSDLYGSLHRLLRRHQDWPERFRMKSQWVVQKIPPTEWQEREHLTVAVGLGNAGQQEIRQNLGLMGQAQQQAAQIPGLIQPQNVFALFRRMQQELGFENENFITDPNSPEYQKFMASQSKPPEDPYVTGKKIDAQVKTQQLASDQQGKLIDLQGKREELAAKRDQWITELEVKSAVDLAKPGIGAEVAGGAPAPGTGGPGASGPSPA